MNPARPTGTSQGRQSTRARRFFSKFGLLAEWHADYEFRPGQLAMAEQVETALAEKRHLLVEAGTGTGKTLAYLIPVIASGNRVVRNSSITKTSRSSKSTSSVPSTSPT